MKTNETDPEALLAHYRGLQDRGDLAGALQGVTDMMGSTISDGQTLIKTLILQASIQRNLGRSAEASRNLDKALRIADSKGLHEVKAEVLRQQSYLSIQTGKPKEAEILAFESLRIARQFGLAKDEANAMACIGHVFEDMREFQKALCWYFGGIEVCDNTEFRERKATLLGDIGKVYGMVGQLMESISYLRKALDLSTDIPYEIAIISSLYRLGDAYRAIKDQARANDYYGQALKRAKDGGYRREEGDCLYRLGLFEIENDRPDEAITFLTESLAIYKSIHYTRQQVFSLLAIGHVLESKVEISEALNTYFEAFEIIGGNADQYIDAFIDVAESIASLWQQLRYVEEAAQIVGLVERLRGQARMSGVFEGLGRKEKISRSVRQIATLIERAKKMEGNIYSHDNVVIDFSKKLATKDDAEITLSRDQWKILWCLWRKRPQPCGRNELLAAVGLRPDTETRTIDVQVYNIRTKIGHQHIPSVRGRGYRLLAD